jgi:hypothetical protein
MYDIEDEKEYCGVGNLLKNCGKLGKSSLVSS